MSPLSETQARITPSASGFRTCPGCFSAGDTLDEALMNAPEAVLLWFESQEEEGRTMPRPRTPSELKADPNHVADMMQHTIALIPVPSRILQPAAE